MAEKPVRKSGGTARRSPSTYDVSHWVAEHHADLYRYAFRLTGSVPDAEDLTQQTFLIAQRKAEQVREAAKVRAWLFTVLRSCFLKSRRKRLPLPVGELDSDLDAAAAADFPRESEIDGERLQAALDSLGDGFRLVLTLFFFEGCSYKEIAEQLEIPMGTVMSRLSRAKAHLRSALLALERQSAERRAGAENSAAGRDEGPPPAVEARAEDTRGT